MTIRPYEGHTWVYALTAVPAIPSSPTVAELESGVLLEPAMTADGLNPDNLENVVSTALLSGFTRQTIGTEGVTFDLRMVLDRDTPALAAAWDFFNQRNKPGCLVVVDGPPVEDARAAVYPCRFGRRRPVGSAADTIQQFSVKVAVNRRPTDNAVVNDENVLDVYGGLDSSTAPTNTYGGLDADDVATDTYGGLDA